MEQLGICIIIATFIYCDMKTYLEGQDSFFFTAKTPGEKAYKLRMLYGERFETATTKERREELYKLEEPEDKSKLTWLVGFVLLITVILVFAATLYGKN